MDTAIVFDRCIYCFAPKRTSGSCQSCGYENGLCDMPVWLLMPGTILKGQYMVGRLLRNTETEFTYLGWDLKRERLLEITEFFSQRTMTRDITHSVEVSYIPGKEDHARQEISEFAEKVTRNAHCTAPESLPVLDGFLRNNTAYVVRKIEF